MKVCTETPPRFGGVKEEVSARCPSIDKMRFSSSTKFLSVPSTSTPKVTDPEGCIVSRLSSMRKCDFVSASRICVASLNPSVSMVSDLIPTARPENGVKFDKAAFCLLLKSRGAISASNFRFASFRTCVSCSSLSARIFAARSAGCDRVSLSPSNLDCAASCDTRVLRDCHWTKNVPIIASAVNAAAIPTDLRYHLSQKFGAIF